MKRKSDVITDEEDWNFLKRFITPYFIKKIEKICAQVPNYQCQLVHTTPSELHFAVWRVNYDKDSDVESESDVDIDDESESELDDEVELGPEAIPCRDGTEAKQAEGAKEWDDFKPFYWRRVRTVILKHSPSEKKILCIAIAKSVRLPVFRALINSKLWFRSIQCA